MPVRLKITKKQKEYENLIILLSFVKNNCSILPYVYMKRYLQQNSPPGCLRAFCPFTTFYVRMCTYSSSHDSIFIIHLPH